MSKFVSILLFAAMLVPGFARAQDTLTVPNDFVLGTINNTIQGDTLPNGDRANPNRVYKLLRGGYYLLNGAITTKLGTHIRIEGEPAPATGTDPGMPVVIEGAVTGLYYFFTIDCYGDLTMKNVWMIYATQVGTQNWTALQFENDTTRHHSRGEFDNCIFDYVNGLAVSCNGVGFTGIFKNCIWRNSIDMGQWWAGRAFTTISTGAQVDTIWSENCSYINQGFSFQTDYTPPKFVFYNHNTFVNIAKFPFKFYWMTHLICTNNVFVNCHFTGERYADRIGQDPDNYLYGAVLDVDTIPSGTTYNGVTEDQRVVLFQNNSNFTQADFQTYYTSYNNIDSVKNSPAGLRAKIQPEPMMNQRTLDMFTWHPFMKMNAATVYDGEDPGFDVAPTQLDSILAFLQCRYVTGGTVFWGFHPDLNGTWPLTENLHYSNATLRAAGMGGHPLGDLYHWFPTDYATWSTQAAAEDAAIITLSTSDVKQVPGTVPAEFTLQQNFPNPFNPATQIEYTVPKASHVTLKVYNVVGQEVATLFSGQQAPGTYRASFDGARLSSGVYFYRMQAGDVSLTRKMVLVK